MKRLFSALLCLLALAPFASGLSLNFQNVGDTTDVIGIGVSGGYISWVESSTGGNNYLLVVGSPTPFSGGDYYAINKYAIPTTYAAADLVSTDANAYPRVKLFDSSYNTLYTYNGGTAHGRWEVKIVGGRARVYLDGTLQDTSGLLAVNPSYIGWGSGTSNFRGYCGWDNIIWGDTDSKYIVGMPETNDGGSYKFALKKSIISPADSGLINANTFVTVSAYNMTTTWSKNNAAAETLYLEHTGTGAIVASQSVSGYTGSVSWPLQEAIFNNANADFGSYVAYLSGSPATISTPIQYITGGATIFWNQQLYSANDNAAFTWNIQNDYWALRSAGYVFSYKVIDVYGQTKATSTITTQTGNAAYTFAESDPDGVYYIALIATPSGGNEAWVAYDYATLTGYLTFVGYVNDAQTAHRINVANVTITQGSTSL